MRRSQRKHFAISKQVKIVEAISPNTPWALQTVTAQDQESSGGRIRLISVELTLSRSPRSNLSSVQPNPNPGPRLHADF